eukprot:TRINITY_DN13309_c0_g1_i2.p1 TRINITY_DN13309_c0_g1~~TRINITY_DN13309_c0_g1_i2.p1  ORF type:complete len:474 (-),score=109.08 TRINITY_DN13309_c0_g1_i2:111-1532(-)
MYLRQPPLAAAGGRGEAFSRHVLALAVSLHLILAILHRGRAFLQQPKLGSSGGYLRGESARGRGGAHRTYIVALRATDERAAEEAQEEGWAAGPADVQSPPAARALQHLKFDPLLLLFDATVREELISLHRSREKERRDQFSLPSARSAPLDVTVLRRRVREVREKERRMAVAELLYLMVCSRFKHQGVTMIPSLKAGGIVQFKEEGTENLQGLTEIYSLEALELVRDHLFGIIDQTMTAETVKSSRDTGVARIALFQAGQVYAMSTLFGYHLRRSDSRYQLEKLLGALGDFGEDDDDFDEDDVEDFLNDAGEFDETEGHRRHRRPAPPWMEPSWVEIDGTRAEMSLREYIGNFSTDDLRRIRAVASVEAKHTMEVQVSALFGDMRELKSRLLDAVGMVGSQKEAYQKLKQLVEWGEVESIRISKEDLRRLILEAVAFGTLMCDAEREVDSVYELTPRPGSGPSRRYLPQVGN